MRYELRRLLCFLLVIALPFLFNDCAAGPERSQPPKPISEALYNRLYKTESQLRAIMSDTTILAHDPEHGTQVEYTSAGGRCYLWYPGNQVIMRGEWKLELAVMESSLRIRTAKGVEAQRIAVPRLCFRYGPGTYNPVTGIKVGKWSCQDSQLSLLLNQERRKGDIFGLSRRRVPPFVLEPKNTTLNALLKKCKDC